MATTHTSPGRAASHGDKQPRKPARASKHTRRQRLEARITAEQKRLFQQAADIQGVTLTDFVVASVQAAASRAIEESAILTLRARDREVFVQALLNPPAPNDRLLSAARRYRELQGA